jgi:predicted RNA binding protein YcfA (HicA-like mRNA interferase family)
MKIPRDCSGDSLTRALRKSFGYELTRQSGSHIVLTTQRNGVHHITIPAHRPIKIGTLHGILKDVATHHQLTPEILLQRLEL